MSAREVARGVGEDVLGIWAIMAMLVGGGLVMLFAIMVPILLVFALIVGVKEAIGA